ncbi:MAG: hypothetical protein ACO1O3_11890 [Sphingobium sp.]
MAGSYRINRMIQDLNGDPAARERHRADPAATYARYDINIGEQALLADGSIAAMTRLGVHPNLQMKWMLIDAKGPPPASGPLASFIGRLLAGPNAEDN